MLTPSVPARLTSFPDGSSANFALPGCVMTWYGGVPAANVMVRVSPEAVTETIGGLSLLGGSGSGQDSEAVPVSVQAPGEGWFAVEPALPHAERSSKARSGTVRSNFAFNGREG